MSYHYPITCFVFFFLVIHFLHIIEAGNNGGFSVKLIHQKKPQSYYHSRRLLMGSKPNTAQSVTHAYIGHYLMELSIGTPARTIFGIADTGSDLIWTQCVPCDNCYKQINPLFDPKSSSTYMDIPCESDACNKLDTRTCSAQNQLCSYTYAYASASQTEGTLAHEKFTFNSTTGDSVSLEGMIFGCGHNDTGTFNDHEMVIIGLGRGAVSLISQIGSSFGSKRFSHCLVPFHTDFSISSKISFGDGSEVSGDGVVSTPMITDKDNTFYYVTLLGISVGDSYIPFGVTSENVTKGNMFIDSGTPPTILPKQLYDRVADEVRQQVGLRPIENDPDLGSQLCYKSENNVQGPVITSHFDGADVELTPIQTFIPPKDGVFCLAFSDDTTDDVGIFGNFAQSNFLIGFDLDRQVVSFKPTDCTKQ